MSFASFIRKSLGFGVTPVADQPQQGWTLHAPPPALVAGFAGGGDLLSYLSTASYGALAQAGYADSAVAYRCISLIARSAASVPWLLYDTSSKDRKEVIQHPALSLINRPSPLMRTREALIEALVSHLVIGGNSYLLGIGPEADAPPRELYPIQPDRVSVSEAALSLPTYRINDSRLGHHTYTPDPLTGRCPLLHLKRFSPRDVLLGQGDTQPAMSAIAQHLAAGRWNVSLLNNGGRPSLAIIYDPQDGSPPSLTDEQFARLQSEIRANHSGTANAGSIMVLDGGLTAKELSISPKDMDWLAGRQQAAIEIAMAFGVPAQLIGIPDAQTYANLEQARLSFWEDTVLPILRLVVAEVNQWLWPAYGEEGFTFDLDEDAIPALTERRYATFAKLKDADFLTADEKRAAVGYGPIEGGDKLSPPSPPAPRTPSANPAKGADDAAAVVKQSLIRDGWPEADAEAMTRKG